MFYDLDVPYAANDAQLPRTLAFLHELGYHAVALNHHMSGKLPTQLNCAIPDPLPSPQGRDVPEKLTILRRVTLTLTEMHANARLAELGKNYDLLALRAIDERTLSQACGSLECDIITLDLSVRLPFFFKHKMLNEAVRAGKKVEIGYGCGMTGGASAGPDARRNLIANATQLIRACRGRGIIVSSGARSALAARGPWDVVNLTTIWGLGQERGYEAVSKEPRDVVVNARLKRTAYRGVIDVVYGGEKPVATTNEKDVNKHGDDHGHKGQKRKALGPPADQEAGGEKVLSKTQMKKRARLEAVAAVQQQQSANATG